MSIANVSEIDFKLHDDYFASSGNESAIVWVDSEWVVR